ncbi:MAG: c-type cytochrome [Ectothiorhodospiraceae bacterium]|nr:c-type cytochrome [Ectothiorhodospiraceae bacterium]
MGKLSRKLTVFVGLALALPSAAPADEPVADTMQQRVMPCMACHAETSINLRSGFVPSLHGKPSGYLFNQLVHYQEGRRHHRMMEYMVRNMSPEYLLEIAEYFAGLDASLLDAAEPLDNAELRDRGEELVTRGDPSRDLPSCKACHGERLTGAEPNTPGLLGLPSHYVAAQMTAWRMGRREAAEPDCMKEIAQRLTPQDIYALSRWLAAQPVPANSAPEAEPLSDLPMHCGSVQTPE